MTAGLFVADRRSADLDRAFLRLAAETAGRVEWWFVLDPGPAGGLETTLEHPDPAHVLPARHAAATAGGGRLLDVTLVPLVLGLRDRHVWCLRAQAAYPGRIKGATAVLADEDGLTDDDADLVVGGIAPRASDAGWAGWADATAPSWVPERAFARATGPLVRLSRSFAQAYALMTADEDWRGPGEFTLLGAAVAGGARVVDLDGDGPTADGAAGRRRV